MSRGFPIPKFRYPDEADAIIRDCWEALGSWRRFLIVIDGRDGVGKTSFARFLAYRLNMPHYGGDEFLKKGKLEHIAALAAVLHRRLGKDRPLVFDSIFAKDVCARLGLVPDYLIRVSRVGVLGMDRYQQQYSQYEKRVSPDAHLVLPCVDFPRTCTMIGKRPQRECPDCRATRWLEDQAWPWSHVTLKQQ